MKVSDFVGAIAGANGLARTNRFSIQLMPPSFVLRNMGNNGNSAALRDLLLFCDSTQLPGININTAQIRSFGEVREIPYETNYEPITLSFYVDNALQVKRLFDIWILGVQGLDTRKFKFYNDYISDLIINVQDMSDDTQYQAKLFEAYPKTVSAVQMDYANRDVMKIQVTFMYKYWRPYVKDTLIGATKLPDQLAYPQSGTFPNQYFEDFEAFQEEYSYQYGYPESFNSYTGDSVITL